jgi:hypothetical protein
VLHDPVLERVKRNHRQPGAGAQQPGGRDEKFVEAVELAVDPDPERLKSSRRRIDSLITLARNRAPHDLRQLPGRGDPSGTTRLDNAPGDAPRIPLLAVLKNHVGQVFFSGRSEKIGRRRSLRLVHPHIQRLVASEAEPAAFGVELHRRHAQVRQTTGYGIDAAGLQHRRQVAEVGVHQFHLRLPCRERFGCDRQGCGIAIEAKHPRRTTGQQRARMSTQADRAVHEQAAARRIEQRNRLGDEHGLVGRMVAHIPNPESARASSSV